MSRDAKIGFLTLTLVVLALLYNSLQKKSAVLFSSEVNLLFTQVHGLRAGDPVTIGGVPAGRVVKIDFAPPEIQESFAPITGGTKLVRAEVDLSGRQRIPRESTYSVRIDLSGRRWLDITLSPSEEMIGPEDNFFAESAFGQDDQMNRTLQAFTTLATQTEELRAQLADPQFLLRTKDTASNLRFYSRELVDASGEAPAQLEALDKGLDRQERLLLAQMESFDERIDALSKRMREMTPQMTETLEGWSLRMERQGDRLSATLEMAGRKSEEYQQLLDKLIEKQLNPKNIEALVKRTRIWSRKLQEYRYMAEDLHSLTSDPTIRSDLKKAIDDFRVRSEQLDERLLKLEKRLKENPLTKSLVNEEDLQQR